MSPDLSRPHLARIVDYWLGGDHNFSIDREAVDRIGCVGRLMRDMHRQHRNFMKRAIAYMIYNQDIHHFIDFASALPTCGNVHEIALEYDPDAVVIYSDIDPEVVEYGRDILEKAGLSNVRYEWADARRPEELLNSPGVRELLGDVRRVGFGYTSLPHLLPDDQLDRSTSQLYAWAAKGSHLMASFANEVWLQNEKLKTVKLTVSDVYYRTTTRTLELMHPWQLTEHGVTHTSWPDETPPANALGSAHGVFLTRK